jgi:hypothetical protein
MYKQKLRAQNRALVYAYVFKMLNISTKMYIFYNQLLPRSSFFTFVNLRVYILNVRHFQNSLISINTKKQTFT